MIPQICCQRPMIYLFVSCFYVCSDIENPVINSSVHNDELFYFQRHRFTELFRQSDVKLLNVVAQGVLVGKNAGHPLFYISD